MFFTVQILKNFLSEGYLFKMSISPDTGFLGYDVDKLVSVGFWEGVGGVLG